MMKHVAKFLRRFTEDNRGTVAVEAVIILPILFWAYMASYVFFDAYRARSSTEKAAFTISDILSRETTEVHEGYMQSLHSLFDLMVESDTPTGLRVTSITWNDRREEYRLEWSHAEGPMTAFTNSTLQNISEQLPIMVEGESIVLVETNSGYHPLMNVGMGNLSINTFIFSRPRFVQQVAWTRNYD